VVPRSWIEESLTPHIRAHDDLNYGYNWYLGRYAGYKVQFAWGYGGQFLYIVPALDMVVVMTTNTHDFEPDFEGADLMKRLILPSAVGNLP